jgi:VIT1/CCC1 family predicted Fe2+/Mn2+ transporter
MDSDKLKSYISDFVYGGTDGTVTTFAVVSGVAGAALAPSIVIILGLANLLADGFSMGASSFLASRADRENEQRIKQREKLLIEKEPALQKTILKQSLSDREFPPALLNKIIDHLTKQKKTFLSAILAHKYNLHATNNKSPASSALMTFLAFILIGSIPLLPYLISLFYPLSNLFMLSIIFTTLAFIVIGVVKGYVVEMSKTRSTLELLLVGWLAAGISYGIGFLLRGLAG